MNSRFQWSRLSVHIAEADSLTAAAVASVLKRAGTGTLVQTARPSDAVAALEQGVPDVLLLGEDLDGTPGLALAAKVHARRPLPNALPLTMLLAPGLGARESKAARQAGIIGLVRLPLSADALLKQIPNAVLDWQRRTGGGWACESGLRLVAVKRPKAAGGPPDIAKAKAKAKQPAGPVETVDAPPKKAKSGAPVGIEPAAPDKGGVKKRGNAWRNALAGDDAKSGRTKGQRQPPDLGAAIADHGAWLESRGAKGRRVSLPGADLAGCTIAGADLSSANLQGAVLADADVSGAVLRSADLRRADLSGSRLAEADLGVASLRHADLSFAHLDGASFKGADLAGATLRGASLVGTDFSGANLLEADIGEADLSQALGINERQASKTRGNAKTRLPPGVFVSWSNGGGDDGTR